MLELWDKFVVGLWLIVPVLLILKWTNWKGLVLGALYFYLFGVCLGRDTFRNS